MDIQLLLALTSGAAATQRLVERQMETIARLEAATGRTLVIKSFF